MPPIKLTEPLTENFILSSPFKIIGRLNGMVKNGSKMVHVGKKATKYPEHEYAKFSEAAKKKINVDKLEAA